MKTHKNLILKASVIITFLLVIQGTFALPQNQEFTEYKGTVIDSKTKKELVFADLTVEGTNISTITNNEGKFLLKVPNTYSNKKLVVSFLGYYTKKVSLSELTKRNNKITLDIHITELSQVDVNYPKNVKKIIEEMLSRKGLNYFDRSTVMTAFYRETIKKRRKNASLSEAVLEIYKQPYTNLKSDQVRLIKARKNTDYSRLDTVALKLQGGPFSTLYSDLMKYPDYVFNEDFLSTYVFSFDKFTQVNNRSVYVIDFEPHPTVTIPLYSGKLYIDSNSFALLSAVYTLDVSNKEVASKLFIRKKPRKAKVYPTHVAYRIDYRTKGNKWYYGYSNAQLTFKINWDNRLFNSVYTLSCEMAITDWKNNTSQQNIKLKDRLKPTVILTEAASGFSDPDFWGEYNIIEPEKSIESAIKKINKQLKKLNSK